MTLQSMTWAGALLLAPALAAPVHAQVSNGGFESGLAGWATLGDSSTQAGAPAGDRQLWLTTAAAIYQDDFPAAVGARNRSGVGAAEVGISDGVENFVGLAIGALDPSPADGTYAYEGSAARQTVNTLAGDALSFRWEMGSSDSMSDIAFVVIDGVLTVLAQSSQARQPGTQGNSWRTGFSTFNHTFAVGGLHTLAFGVVDVGDYAATSTLSVDNVQIGLVVPEASGVLMGLAGVALLAAARLRRRR